MNRAGSAGIAVESAQNGTSGRPCNFTRGGKSVSAPMRKHSGADQGEAFQE
jgi:hypothetical protein